VWICTKPCLTPFCAPPQVTPGVPGQPGNMPWHPIPGAPTLTGDVEGKCSGDFISAAIVDHVILPMDLAAGDYVLGFRWDCEETAQIWESCADVTIAIAASASSP